MKKEALKKLAEQNCCFDDICDIEREVPFSCATEIPANFDTSNINSNNLRVIFNTHKLSCCQDTCELECTLPGGTGSIPITLNALKIVGCIEYGFAVGPVRGDSSGPNPPRTAPICCYNTVCVNNVVSVSVDDIECPEIMPEDVTLKEDSLEYSIETVNNKKVIIFTGVFELVDLLNGI